jgi:hypothetical protein
MFRTATCLIGEALPRSLLSILTLVFERQTNLCNYFYVATTAVCHRLFVGAFSTMFALSNFVASTRSRRIAFGVVVLLSTLIDGGAALEQCNFTLSSAAGCWCVSSMGAGSCITSSAGYGYTYIGDYAPFPLANSLLVGSKYYGNGCVLINGTTYSSWGAINPCAGTIQGFCKLGAIESCCFQSNCIDNNSTPLSTATSTIRPTTVTSTTTVTATEATITATTIAARTAAQDYSDNDWTTLKEFFAEAGYYCSMASVLFPKPVSFFFSKLITTYFWFFLKNIYLKKGCKSSFCNTLRTNRTCIQHTPPVICDGLGNVVEL